MRTMNMHRCRSAGAEHFPPRSFTRCQPTTCHASHLPSCPALKHRSDSGSCGRHAASMTSHRHIAAPAGCSVRYPCLCSSNGSSRAGGRQRGAVIVAALPGAENAAAVYVGLGAVAASFVGTFAIAPQFKDALREPEDYKTIFQVLQRTGVKSVTPAEALARSKKGSVLLDVRLADKYEANHAARAVSVPLYRPIQGWDAPSTIRRLGFSFFGIFPATELVPTFVQDAAKVLPKGREVMVMCEMGGSLEGGDAFGKQSRSLKALFYLQCAGYKVTHVKGGLSQWVREGLPTSDDGDDTDNEGGETVSDGGLFGRLLQRSGA